MFLGKKEYNNAFKPKFSLKIIKMTNKFNYTTRIVVIIAILALLFGLIIGGIFSILNENEDNGFYDNGQMKISDYTYGYNLVDNHMYLSEIEYNSCCKDCNVKPRSGRTARIVGGQISPL